MVGVRQIGHGLPARLFTVSLHSVQLSSVMSSDSVESSSEGY